MHIKKGDMRYSKSFRLTTWIISIIFILFILLPIIRILSLISPSSIFTQLLTPQNINSVEITLYAATISTIIIIFFGFPLAYLLSRFSFPGKKILDAIVEIPIMIPHSVVGIGLLFVFAASEPGGILFNYFGISFGYNILAVVMAYIFVSGTYAIKTMEEAIKSLPPRMEIVARTLGASQLQVIFRIVLPQTARSILTGAILSWSRAVSEVGAILIVAPYIIPGYESIAGVEVYNQFEVTGLEGAVGISSLLIIISLTIFIILKIIQGQERLFYVPRLRT
jgi:molybdate/tungstate transport system permease protein